MNKNNQLTSVAKITIKMALVMGCSIFMNEANAVTWENQAERLQLVSASFLDAQPLLSPSLESNTDGEFRIEAKAIASVLPKLNATVGAKTEQPPQPPAHAVPTLEVWYLSPTTRAGHALLRAWAGALPEQAAKATGMTASCGQNIKGLSLGLRVDALGHLDGIFEAGQQWSAAKVKGGITELTSNDEFSVASKLRFYSVTLVPHAFYSLWFQAQVVERDVSVHFEIPADGTTFNLNDHSTLGDGTASSQFAIGYIFGNGIQVALAALNVPHRVTMPRILLSYSMVIGGVSHQLASKNY